VAPPKALTSDYRHPGVQDDEQGDQAANK
jgi:hypothetical protein